MKKRILSIWLICCMMLTMLPVTAHAEESEQFNLSPGGTYYFDLSAVEIPGRQHTTMPDTSLHYVPFIYAGTVNSYVLYATANGYGDASNEASVATDPLDCEYGYTYPHSLFVSEYGMKYAVSWDSLNAKDLIYGKQYSSGNVSYVLRAPTVGNDGGRNPFDGHMSPENNEWDSLVDKNENFIKRWDGLATHGQDKYRYDHTVYAALRGSQGIRRWYMQHTYDSADSFGYRPVLQVAYPYQLGKDGLQPVSLNLNGGTLGNITDSINIIVMKGMDYTAPASEGLKRPEGDTGSFFVWVDNNGKFYNPGDTVPANVTSLTAKWVPDTYTVNLNKNGGTIVSGKDLTSYTYGEGATLPTKYDIKRVGYAFEGWYTKADFSGSPVTEISNTDMGEKTFYAKWRQKADAGLSVDAVPEKTYGDPAFKLNVHVNSNGKLTYSSDNVNTATVDSNGNVTIHQVGTAKLTVQVAETDDYQSGQVTVTINVVRKDATLTVNQMTYNVVYGDADFSIGYTREGESDVTFTSFNTNVAAVDTNGKVHIEGVGSTTIKLNMEQSGNYNAVSETVNVVVAKKKITVTADDKTKTYAEDDPELTYTAAGLVGKDVLNGITLTRAEGEDAAGYTISISQVTGANPNYDITFVPGTLTIAARDIADARVELGAALITNGETQEQEIRRVTVKDPDEKEMEVTYTVTGNQEVEPGAYTMTINGTGNFTGTVTKTFVIAPAADSEVDTNENGDVVIGNGMISIKVMQENGAPTTEIKTGKAAIIEMLVAEGDMTAEELSQMADGASICVLLKVTDVSESITEESKEQIEKAAEDYVVGEYIDISLFKQINCNDQTGELIQLFGTYEEIEISLVVPENLVNRDDSMIRTFRVIRNHDGKVEILPTNHDVQMNTLNFKTDKFSDYAIAYQDTKKPVENTSTPNNTSAKTGDSTNNLWIWFILMFASFVGMIKIIYFDKKKKTE